MRFLGRVMDVVSHRGRYVVTGCLLAGTMLALTACGSSSNSSSSTAGGASSGGNTIDIYSSFPLQGAQTGQTVPTVNGIKLALSQAGGKAGQFKVNYTSLDDSTAAKGNYDLGQCAANGRKVATDPKAVLYIGEYNSGCTKVSLPILNQAGIPMISPANTLVGLTTNEPGSAPGEPHKYYPTGKRTYMRIVPRDSIQAGDDLMAMKQAGCTKVAVANPKTPYGAGLAQLLELQKKNYGITITSNTGTDPTAPNYRSYAATIKGQGADCFFFSGEVASGAVQITKDVHAAIPTAKIFAPDGSCTATWTNPKEGGVPASIDPLIECTVATQPLKAYPGGVNPFLPAYKAKYGVANPDPYAIYGYTAMKIALDTIAKLGSKGNDKSAVLQALFTSSYPHTVLGSFKFDSNGDTTLKSYGLYKVGPDGNLVFYKTLTPSKTTTTTTTTTTK